MGEMAVPADALYGASTQRAVLNFPISGRPMPPAFIHALGLVKQAAAETNLALGLLEPALAAAVIAAAAEVAAGKHDDAFPIDIYQTGSGTSTNMNANEVIAHLASARLGAPVHPNDHINAAQSSNDVIPSAMQLAAAIEINKILLPALEVLHRSLAAKAAEFDPVVKTGRTHLRTRRRSGSARSSPGTPARWTPRSGGPGPRSTSSSACLWAARPSAPG